MRIFRSRITFALCLVLLTCVVLGIVAGVMRYRSAMRDLAALEATANHTSLEYYSAGPSLIPESIMAWVQKKIVEWVDGKKNPQKSKRLIDGLHLACGGNITGIGINVKQIHGDMGGALGRFTALEEFHLYGEPGITDAEFASVCSALRHLPRLKGLTLWGRSMTDDALAPLAGHPSLVSLELAGIITPDIAQTLGSMPALTNLNVVTPVKPLFPPVSQEKRDAIRRAVPARISITYR